MPGAGEDEGIVFLRLADEQSTVFQQANDLPDPSPFFRVEWGDQFIARWPRHGLREGQAGGWPERQSAVWIQ